jgi:lysophospholipid acyltransferase (LPLAT)-like uncharacterized protein
LSSRHTRRQRGWQRLLAHPALARAVGTATAWGLRILGSTWRLSYEGPDPLDRGEPILGAFWHRNLVAASFAFRDRGFGVAVSRSRDGDLITGSLVALGYGAIARGSSSRGGGAALLGLVRAVRSGTTISLQPDGPRGPARRAKPGIVALARVTGAPIVPIAFSGRPCLRLRSWDRALVPWPFARVVCRWGSPLHVASDCDEASERDYTRQLEASLDELTDSLDTRFDLDDRKANPVGNAGGGS